VSGVHWHPSVLLGLALLVAGYALARWTAPRSEAGGPRDVALFLAGGLAMAVALVGPLDEWAEHAALSAHMIQHLVLTLVVPPLWLAGTPPGVLRLLLSVPGVRTAGRVLTRPPVALALAGGGLGVWHLPALFQAALADEAVHILEHRTLLGTALLGWWPVAGRLPEWPRPAPPAQLLYLFLCTVPMTLVAAPITLAEDLLYPYYAGVAGGWPLSPRADQELAGVIMWLGGTVAYVIAGSVVFFRWAVREEPGEHAVALPGQP
jgi:cytochrome c oxidase assembly factor CtaG